MFVQDKKEKKWWYRCETCGKETEKRNDHDSAEGLEGWRVEGYVDAHICPKCQSERNI